MRLLRWSPYISEVLVKPNPATVEDRNSRDCKASIACANALVWIQSQVAVLTRVLSRLPGLDVRIVYQLVQITMVYHLPDLRNTFLRTLTKTLTQMSGPDAQVTLKLPGACGA